MFNEIHTLKGLTILSSQLFGLGQDKKGLYGISLGHPA